MNVLKCFLLLGLLFPHPLVEHHAEDKILGKWITSEKKNLIVSVYKEGGEFRAKVIWFNDSDDPSRPMNSRKDIHNPDEHLRNQRIIGMDVLKDLKYNPKSNRWEDGLIYDPLSGREWSSVVWLDKEGELKVKGYWHFEFLSKTLVFDKMD